MFVDYNKFDLLHQAHCSQIQHGFKDCLNDTAQ